MISNGVSIFRLAGILSAGLIAASAGAQTFQKGDVFVSYGSLFSTAKIEWYRPNGNVVTLIKTLDAGILGEGCGMAFDQKNNLYLTIFDTSYVVVFNPNGQKIGTFGSGYDAHPESVVFDAAGNVYVGLADGTANIVKVNPVGVQTGNSDVVTGWRGPAAMDLAADQTTMYYTTQDSHIRRFDIKSQQQIEDFVTTLPGTLAFAFRLLPSGGMLVADTENILRLDGFGNIIKTYDTSFENRWFALNLDPNGKSFWSAGTETRYIRKFDIATGALQLEFQGAKASTKIGGLTVLGEITVATNGPPTINCPNPVTMEQTSSPTTPVTLLAHVTDMDGDPLVVKWYVDGILRSTQNVPSGGPPTDADVTFKDGYLVGKHLITVSVTDGKTDPTTCDSSVTITNSGPTIQCPLPVTIDQNTKNGGKVTLRGHAEDITGDGLTIIWYVGGVPVHTQTKSAGPAPTVMDFEFTYEYPIGESVIAINVSDGTNQNGCSTSVNVVAKPCDTSLLPNLICTSPICRDLLNGELHRIFRPEVINLDDITIRDVLECKFVDMTRVIVQAVKLSKVTPVLKCTLFVTGIGSDLNTNFATSLKKATNADLDYPVCSVALQRPPTGPCLGTRCLLFSPPGTRYTLTVIYVLSNGSKPPDGPYAAELGFQVKVPTRDDLRCNVEYFSTVAIGVTQKCKIADDVRDALFAALDIPDDLDSLLQIETIVAFASTNFDDFISRNHGDLRFQPGYLIDSTEEPVGCLLIEMANAAFWN